MENMRKTASRLDKFFHVLEIACVVAAVAAGVGLLLIGASFIFKLDPEMIGSGYDMLDIGFADFRLAEGFVPDERGVLGIAAVDMAMAVVLALLGRAFVACVRRLLAPMREGRPFHGDAAGSLRRLAILSLVIGAALNISEIVNGLLTEHVYGLSDLLLSDRILEVQMHSKLDMSCLVVSGVLLLLSYIFRYGQELQQLSDETL